MKRALNTKVLEGMTKPHKKMTFGDLIAKNLLVVIQPSGKIYWKWQGRVDGVIRQIPLGQYPAMGIADARKASAELTEARDLAKMKGEPFEVPQFKPRTRIAPTAIEMPVPAPGLGGKSANWLFDLYMEEEGGKKKSGDEKRRMWDKDISPTIGDKPYADISYDDLAEVVTAKHQTAPGSARHMVSYLKRLFRWAVTTGRPLTKLTVDPAAHLVAMSEPGMVDRFLNEQEIVWLLKTIDHFDDTFSHGLLLTLYNGTRKTEGFEMPWTEYTESKGHWLIPKDRSKNNQALLLPLSATSQALLKRRKEICGAKKWVFPANRGDGAFNSFSKTLEAFRKKMIEIASADAGEPVEIPSWSIHDLRRTLSTGMNGLCDAEGTPMISGDIVERVLNHKQEKVRGTYNWHDYLVEKRRALMLWSEYLDGLHGRARQSAMKQAA